jgi:hypothetical protein
MSDNEGEGSGGCRDKGETSEPAIRTPKHLVMGQKDMAKEITDLVLNCRICQHKSKYKQRKSILERPIPELNPISRMRTTWC